MTETVLLVIFNDNFHICTVHLDFIKVFYSTDAQVIVFKKQY